MQTQSKQEVIKKYARSESDTGSTEVQLAVLTARIKDITGHLQAHPKDKHSMRGLIGLVNRRRKLQKYLHAENPEKYRALITELGIRG